MAKLREARDAAHLARESSPERVQKRMRFAERYQKEQHCQYAGLTGPLGDWLQSSQCFGEPSLAFSRPLFEEARALGFTRFNRYEGVGCCTFRFESNEETCGRGACSTKQ